MWDGHEALDCATVVIDGTARPSASLIAQVGVFDEVILWNCAGNRALARTFELARFRPLDVDGHVSRVVAWVRPKVFFVAFADSASGRIPVAPPPVARPATAAIESAPDALPTEAFVREPIPAGPQVTRWRPLVVEALAAIDKYTPDNVAKILAIIEGESTGIAYGRDSNKGAIGLMQIRGMYAQALGTTPAGLRQPSINIRIGTKFFMNNCVPAARKYVAEHPTYDVDIVAFAMYNAGIAGVQSYKTWPAETSAYARDVYSFYQRNRVQ